MQWHQRALDIAEQIGCGRGQGRAYGDLGLTYEALGNFERAVFYQEQHLSVAAQTNDLVAKTLAYGSLGRTHHSLHNFAQAVMYLQEGREVHGVFLLREILLFSAQNTGRVCSYLLGKSLDCDVLLQFLHPLCVNLHQLLHVLQQDTTSNIHPETCLMAINNSRRATSLLQVRHSVKQKC